MIEVVSTGVFVLAAFTSSMVCNINPWSLPFVSGQWDFWKSVLWETANPGGYLHTDSFLYFQVSSSQKILA